MYYIDQGDGANYHPLPLLETVAAVAYSNLVIVKQEWQNLIYSFFRFKLSKYSVQVNRRCPRYPKETCNGTYC